MPAVVPTEEGLPLPSPYLCVGARGHSRHASAFLLNSSLGWAQGSSPVLTQLRPRNSVSSLATYGEACDVTSELASTRQLSALLRVGFLDRARERLGSEERRQRRGRTVNCRGLGCRRDVSKGTGAALPYSWAHSGQAGGREQASGAWSEKASRLDPHSWGRRVKCVVVAAALQGPSVLCG